MQGFLLLEDGTRFYGEIFGDNHCTIGEVVFSTSMTGYQEGITDPSYFGQILVLTYPLIGNVGFNKYDFESNKISVKALIIKELCDVPSNWAKEGTLDQFMKHYNIVGLSGVDTRALVLRIRETRVMRGIICTSEPTKEQLDKLHAFTIDKPIENVTCKEVHKLPCTGASSGKSVAILDFGVKGNILTQLQNKGHDLTVYPALTSAEQILKGNHDGILLTNGPGNPAENPQIVATIQSLMGKLPIMGICMGHQLLAIANGLTSYKMRYGHRGANQPVKDFKKNRVFITSQNHGYAINEPEGKNVIVTHRSVNDKTIEGLRYTDHPSFSVQFHPEACPGPLDTDYLFDEFSQMMEENKNAKR